MLIGQRDIAISRPDKVLYPDARLTKADVVEHYRRVAGVILPHLRERPLSLRRYPDGIEADGFFQKEASEHFPDWVDVADVPLREDGVGHHVVCSDEETLVYLANQATIEFHIWPSTVEALDNPDRMVIDINPPDDAEASELRSVARLVLAHHALVLAGRALVLARRALVLAAQRPSAAYAPTVPSMASRRKSAWPLCRAYS